jgi:hypothetical protein
MRGTFLFENLRGRALARRRLKCEYNIRIDLTEICWKGVDWIHLAQDRD